MTAGEYILYLYLVVGLLFGILVCSSAIMFDNTRLQLTKLEKILGVLILILFWPMFILWAME